MLFNFLNKKQLASRNKKYSFALQFEFNLEVPG